MPLPPSLAALYPGFGYEQGLTDKMALQGRDAAKRQASDLAVTNAQATNPTQGVHPLPSGDVGSDWGPFFESLQENHASIGGAKGSNAMPGLSTDPATGTVPLSMQGLTNATYGYDGTRPTSVTFAPPKNVGDPKTGRALALQQSDQANATATAAANPSIGDSGAPDTSATSAIAKQRATQLAMMASAGQSRRGF